ncbi:MAG: hypothetical protein M3N31_07605, partial [Actinomycetota bacterium]|nr:hypothetical protein [Actinomycetota bacterium]
MPTRSERTERSRRWPGAGPLAWSMVALTFALNVAFAAVDLEEYLASGDFPFYLAGMAAAGVGGLVASRRPGNPMGWLFCALGLLSAVDAITYGVATQVSPDAPETSLWAWA